MQQDKTSLKHGIKKNKDKGKTRTLDLIDHDEAIVIDAWGNSPLHFACINADLIKVQSLLKNGAILSIRQQNREKETPLHALCQSNSNLGINKDDNHEENAIKILELLFENGAEEFINIKNIQGRTPIALACEFGNYDIVKYLLDKHANIYVYDNCHNTVLHHICRGNIYFNCDSIQALKLLFEYGVLKIINQRNLGGLLPFHLACANLDSRIALLFKEKGALSFLKTKDIKMAFIIAIKKGTFETVKLLLENGAKAFINQGLDENENTALHLACIDNHDSAEKVKILLDYGADPGALNRYLWRPLHCASAGGTSEILSVLLENGGQYYIDASTPLYSPKGLKFYNTALTLAFKAQDNNALEKVRVLLNSGADIDLYGDFIYIEHDIYSSIPLILNYSRLHNSKLQCLLKLTIALNSWDEPITGYSGILDAYYEDRSYFVILIKDILCNKTLFANYGWFYYPWKFKTIIVNALKSCEEIKCNPMIQCLLAFNTGITSLNSKSLTQAYEISQSDFIHLTKEVLCENTLFPQATYKQLYFLITSKLVQQLSEPELLVRLGEFYIKGKYVDQDIKLGIKFFKRACNKNNLIGLKESKKITIIKMYESYCAFFEAQRNKITEANEKELSVDSSEEEMVEMEVLNTYGKH